MNGFTRIRNATLFVIGIAGIVHETLISGAPDPTLLLLFAAMVGLPGFLRKDENSK